MYLKEGRLEIPEGSSYYLKCERCGISINSGRFCQPCASILIKEFNKFLFEHTSKLSLSDIRNFQNNKGNQKEIQNFFINKIKLNNR